MLRDFGRFLRALWSEWVVLLTGGSTVALLALLTFAGAKPISQSVNWLILGTTLVAASFLAWSREWVKGGSGFIDIDFKSLEPIFEGHMPLKGEDFCGNILDSA